MLISSQIIKSLPLALALIFASPFSHGTVGDGPTFLFNAAISSKRSSSEKAHYSSGSTMVRFDTIKQCKAAAQVYLQDALGGFDLEPTGMERLVLTCTDRNNGESLYQFSFSDGSGL